MLVDVYDSTADIYSDDQYVDHMRFEFKDIGSALKFIETVVNDHHKAVVVFAKPDNKVE